MAQPASLYLSRQLVRVMPFAAQQTFFAPANAAAGAVFQAAFDVGLVVTDLNQFLTPATLPVGAGALGAATTPIQAVGPFLDAVVFCTGLGGGTLIVEYAVDYLCTYRQLTSTGVPQNTLVNLSGLRITGRFVRCGFVNVTLNATVEFGTYVRSS